MEKHEPKDEFRDSLGQPNPAHDMQIRTIREKEERDKEADKEAAKEAKEAAKDEKNDDKKAKK